MRVLLACGDERRSAPLASCLQRLGHSLTVETNPARPGLLEEARQYEAVFADWDAPAGERLTTELSQAPRPPILVALTSRAVERAQALIASGAPAIDPRDAGPALDLRVSVILQLLSGRRQEAEALAFLAEASAQLASSLDFDVTLRSIARLAAISLCDYCIIDLLNDDGTTRRAEAATRDPALEPLLVVVRRQQTSPRSAAGVALRTGRASLFEVGPQDLAQLAGSEEHLRVLVELAPRSAIVVPLVAGGKVEGVLSLVSRRVGRYGPRDLHVAQQLCERAGAALANARLHRLVQAELAERRRAEEDLRRSQDQFRALTEATFEAVVIHERGEVLLVNRAMADMLGYGVAEMIGTSTFRYIAPECHETVVAMFREGIARPYETSALHKDGTRFPIEVQVREATFQGRRVRMAAMRDMRERQKLQARMMLADRLAAMGTLAAGVAHEINNPLAFVSLSLELARRRLREMGQEGDPELSRALEDAASGAARVSGIVRDLKTLSRADDEQRHPVDVRALLEAALGIAQNELRHKARVVKSLGTVPLVEGSESRLGQVFLNLLVNAGQAIDEGAPERNEIRIETSTHPSGRACIVVADSGRGISPGVRARIFDPFFTTKPVGVGTGLGLSICHGIVSAMGGEIEVESAVGKGALFRVLLPPAQQPPRPAPVPRDPAKGRRARVLLVDDEPRLRSSLARLLQPTHEVVAVASGREAVDLVRSGAAFDAVLCDVMMPGMDGEQVYAALQEAVPGLARRMIFLTGGAFTARAADFLEQVPNAKLEKPFDPRALLEALRVVTG